MYKIFAVYFAVYFAVFAVSFIGVDLYRRWSLKRDLLDFPNERSSHSVPTPRGGGIIICAVSLLTFCIYSFVSGEIFQWAFLGGAMIVAAISLADDVKTISPVWRLLFHASAAGLAVWAFGGFEAVLVPFYGIIFTGMWGSVLAFLWIVWLINAYNFMDGIDGIAAVQSITAGAGWSLAGYLLGIGDIGFYGGVLAASALGFLILNWQPAKIFMGDVGSAFLGYSFAVIPLLAINKLKSPEPASLMPWIAVIFVWFFVFDSVLTFFKRLFRGEKVWNPHREHIYQKLVIAGLPHSIVTGLYGLASAIIVLVTVTALKYSLGIESIVFGVIVFETILLIIFWQKIVRTRKTFEIK